jgi:hypothetical protein
VAPRKLIPVATATRLVVLGKNARNAIRPQAHATPLAQHPVSAALAIVAMNHNTARPTPLVTRIVGPDAKTRSIVLMALGCTTVASITTKNAVGRLDANLEWSKKMPP